VLRRLPLDRVPESHHHIPTAAPRTSNSTGQGRSRGARALLICFAALRPVCQTVAHVMGEQVAQSPLAMEQKSAYHLACQQDSVPELLVR
jgi:hypothetical protein